MENGKLNLRIYSNANVRFIDVSFYCTVERFLVYSKCVV